MLTEVVQNFVKITLVIVDNSPTTAPAWQTVDFTESTSANYWNCFCHVSEWVKWSLLIITQAIVYLIWDNGNSVLVSDCKNIFNMLLCKARSTGIWWIVNKNCFCIWSNLWFQVLEIYMPSFIGKKIVAVEFNSKVLADGLAEWEAWSSD